MARLKTLSIWTVVLLLVVTLVAVVLGYLAFDKQILSSQRQTEVSGSAALSWTVPTENVDNSPLTDLAGYVIRYGTSAEQYTDTVNIDDPEITSYVFENLSPGTYYFAVSAVTAQGVESALSNVAVKTVR